MVKPIDLAMFGVESIYAKTVKTDAAVSLCLLCDGKNDFGERTSAAMTFYLPTTHEEYARALAAAINAVPVPVTEDA